MSNKQDKATTERHAKTLRELLKRPENKVCADCKRNDPRWASWNLGVFLCIRCSGIHRSMGTHISKVKSVDLDVWTVEQMNSVQKWGNHRANLYWEAHLKAGHVPPDHKMESFIRSKYESRRWAMDGPLPSDPSVLESSATEAHEPSQQPIPAPSTSSTQRFAHAQTSSTGSARLPAITRQPQPHQLLSVGIAGRATQAVSQPAAQHAQATAPAPAAEPAPVAPTANNDLFTLDFHNPTPPAGQPAPKKDVKQDILSLFSTPAAAAAPTPSAFGQFSATAAAPPAQNVWGQFNAAPAAPVQTSMMGNAGTGMWGASSGWNAPVAPAQPNVWGNSMSPPVQQPTQNLFNTSDVWASAGSTSNGTTGSDLFASSLPPKKDDAFGDLWGGFK